MARRSALPTARTRMTGSGRRGECEGGADDSLRGAILRCARRRAGRVASATGGNLTTATWIFFFDLALALKLSRGAFV